MSKKAIGFIVDNTYFEVVDTKVREIFVTPEMFGAVGDGVTDDSAAWQAAVNVGVPVRATKKKYKCGQINITKNISVDFNNAEFICTSQTLINAYGSVITTLTGENNYTAHDNAYAISDSDYDDYTGFAMLKGTNNFEKSRSYYCGGFVCTFRNGIMNGSYPVDVINGTNDISIEIIDPITVCLRNIGNVSHSDTAGSSIKILYGLNCIIEGITADSISKYAFIELNGCLNCVCRSLAISASFGTTGSNSYIVAFSNSSFCSVEDSYLYNQYWHCVTTGGTYLCYHNSVLNSTLLNETGGAYVDHPNGINTILERCVITNVAVGGLSVVNDVTILSCENLTHGCTLTINPLSDPNLCGSYVSNIKFCPNASTPDNACGIVITHSPQVTGQTYYVDSIIIENMTIVGSNRGQLWFGFFNSGNGSYYVVRTIKLINVVGNIYYYKKNTNNDVDMSGAILYLNDCAKKSGSSPLFPQLGLDITSVFGTVIVNNCKLHVIRGLIDLIEMHSVFINNGVSNAIFKVKKIIGSNLEIFFYDNFFVTGDTTYDCSDLRITDVAISKTVKWYNVSNDNAGNKYYQKWASGVLTTVQITV